MPGFIGSFSGARGAARLVDVQKDDDLVAVVGQRALEVGDGM
jgi:hypothetical protein